MRIAFVIFNGMTALDFVGIYDPLTRLKSMNFLPDLEWDVCACSAVVTDSSGLRFTATIAESSLARYDMVVVPGGFGTRTLQDDPEFISWLKTAASCKFKVSVCTGALLLGAAGFLQGRKATTHPSAYQELAKYCASVVDDRVVDEGDVITARGVTSGIDLGLYLCEKFAGTEAKEQIRRQMDYPN